MIKRYIQKADIPLLGTKKGDFWVLDGDIMINEKDMRMQITLYSIALFDDHFTEVYEKEIPVNHQFSIPTVT